MNAGIQNAVVQNVECFLINLYPLPNIQLMYVICSDLEGVFVPEVWINVAEKTGIPELRLTTRDVPDYNVLMRSRIKILEEKGLKLKDIQEVIARIRPLEGALEFIAWLKERTQLIVVSDTFIQFAEPLMKQLGRPTLF